MFLKGTSCLQTWVEDRRTIHTSSRLRPSMPMPIHARFRVQKRYISEYLADVNIWGGSGYILKALEASGCPYWAGFSALSVLLRTALFPVVVYGAHSSARFGKIVPEVQFLMTLFRKDMQKMNERKATVAEKVQLMTMNLQSLSGLYKLHNVHPLSVFLSPLLQIPFFVYISTDMRKIVNGLDPELAQQLVDTEVGWISDLTLADPYLPIVAGIMMYANVEVAVGKQSLAGDNAAKANSGVFMKDMFQSGAVFMPCFTSQMPAGIQIYIVTSFAFTMIQSQALRTNSIREMMGLPPISKTPEAPKYASQLLKLMELEQKAKQARGDGPVLGKHGILAREFEISFAGTARPSTIQGSGVTPIHETPSLSVGDNNPLQQFPKELADMPFIRGVTAPVSQLREQHPDWFDVPAPKPAPVDDRMEKANRGEMPVTTQFVEKPKSRPVKVDAKRLKRKRRK